MMFSGTTRHSLGRIAGCLLLGGLCAACLVDKDQPCSSDMLFDETFGLCVCEPGLAATDEGCVKCGKHEVVGVEGCECEPGYVREGKRCVEFDADAGAMDTGPTGLGVRCSTDADCAEFDARHCDPVITGTCLIVGCTLEGTDCPSGYECADVSGFGGPGLVCIAQMCDSEQSCPSASSCCEFLSGTVTACIAGGCP